MITVSVTGMDKVLATLKALSNGDKLADDAVRKTALNSMIDLIKDSKSKNPKYPYIGFNDTWKRWTSPKKIKSAEYEVSNNYTTRGGKWNVVNILEYGHGELTPKNKYFYIPLNKTAAQKAPGAPIPKGFKRGGKDKDGNRIDGDYVFATKISAVEGRGFIAKNVKAAQAELKQLLLDAVKAAIK